jgi:DNA modification methylase
MFSFAGDTVLDPFGGTGTTAIAALETGRNSISIEIEPTYVDQIEARFAKLGSVVAQIDVSRHLLGNDLLSSAAAG